MSAPGAPLLEVRGPPRRLRPRPGGARHLAPGRRGADRHPHRPERRRQDQHAGRAWPGCSARSGGQVLLEGRDVTGAPGPPRRGSRASSLVPEGRGILARMSIEENLRAGRREPHARARRRRAAPPHRGAVRALPGAGGAAQAAGRVALRGRAADAGLRPGAAHVAAHPAPRRAVDGARAAAGAAASSSLVEEIHREGATVLLVEQNARLALQVSDHAYVLERGRIVLEGPSSGLAADPRVQAAYLGGDVQADRRSIPAAGGGLLRLALGGDASRPRPPAPPRDPRPSSASRSCRS